jgi:hypothetical protein
LISASICSGPESLPAWAVRGNQFAQVFRVAARHHDADQILFIARREGQRQEKLRFGRSGSA